ncbi:MAG: hypothetical protein M1360_03175 [Candidatus Marsarchaeota archaeon]|jgi:hypothetical protein|nr:hypothetical protein [Candidatus Marsarchaeota archaeon]MCL5418915.1 hypothetical protein [Candidatus Marsarchaeota archaeon]
MAKKSQAGAHAKGKYAAELERIKALSDISRIIKKSDVESVLINEIERDSESARTANVDKLLSQITEEDRRHPGEKGLEVIERLTTGEGAVRLSKTSRSSKARKKSQSKKQSKRKQVRKSSKRRARK